MADYEYSDDAEYNDGIEIEEDDNEKKYRKRYKPKKKKIPIGRILGVLFTLLVLTYISMLIYTSNFTMIETEEADQFEVNAYVEVNAIALRQEVYVENTKDGILSYVIDDGQKVNAGGTVAKLFATEADVNNWQEYNEKNEELTLLKSMSNADSNMFVDLDTVDAQIKSGITNFRTQIQGNRLESARESKLKLLQLFNTRTVITGGSANFDSRINQLQSELEAVNVSESIGDVRSKKSGIFVSGLDGYESSIDYTKAESLMADDIANLQKKDPPASAVGKVITTLNWYLLCPITSEQALTVTTGNETVDISIPKVISGSIPGTVVSVNQGSKLEDGLLIIKCDYMDGDLADIREEDITIKTKTYSGLRVNKKAIHEDYITVQDYDENGNAVGEPHEERVQGVYVMYGRRLTFVQVNIMYSDKDFVICNPDVSDPALLNHETIALHDSVVVQGKDLYDGKIIK